MTQTVRVRYAPSPTGEPHVGNIRTAIFNWLFARHHGGTFIVRIEDTDRARVVEGAVEDILEALRWLGMDWDEGPEVGGDHGPYFQSERHRSLDLYRREAHRLVEADRAYLCFCSPERLARLREEQQRRKEAPGYDRLCRGLTPEERRRRQEEGLPYVIRFKMPLEGQTTVRDLIRGEVTFENRLLDDFVIIKSDGFPTYHLAAVVDDHYMGVTHVLRAEEWLPSLPRHLRLYEALGWEPPLFAHLPIILAPDRSKLSKRHGATSVLEYRRMGFLPDAMLNFLTLLGWSLDDRTELFSRQELVRYFTLERVSRSAAVFNMDKLVWMNGHYIRQMTHQELADALLDYWRRYPPPELEDKAPDKEVTLKIAPLVQERIKTLADAAPLVAFLFKEQVHYRAEELVQRGMDAPRTAKALEAALSALEGMNPFEASVIEPALRDLVARLGLKAGQLFGAIRVATTGQRVSPPLFQSLEVLGKERTLERMRQALRLLEGVPSG